MKTKIISHDCYQTNLDTNMYQTELIDYKILCPSNQQQIIDLNDYDSINSISISGNSNVVIKCPSNSIESILIIYDNPNISLENVCMFNSIEIHGYPLFNLMPNSDFSVKNLIVLNNSYQFPFKSIQQLKNTDMIRENYYCDYLKFYINDDSVNIFCNRNSSFQLEISYFLIFNYSFNFLVKNDVDFIFNYSRYRNEYHDYIDFYYFFDYLEQIIQWFDFEDKKKVNFEYCKEIPEVINFTKIFPHKNIEFYVNTKTFCTRINSYDYFRTEEKAGWNKMCLDRYFYLHQSNFKEDIGKVYTISTLKLIISMIVIVVCMLISLFIIACYRYKDYKRVANEKNEDDFSCSEKTD